MNSALEVALINNARLDHEGLTDTHVSAMAGTIDASPGLGIAPGQLNFDDRIGDVQPIPLAVNDRDTLKARRRVEKDLGFVRVKNSGKLADRYTVTFVLEP